MRHGSRTFLAASHLLPRAVADPACALYAFCRVADDAVDLGHDSVQAVARLRERLSRIYAQQPEATVADRALAQVVHRYAIPRTLLDALIEGFEWDSRQRRCETLADLHAYATRVAGTVGAMMSLLMGQRDAQALARACELGVAMQLSNIARDVGEDARAGRLYLPLDWLREAGIAPDSWLADPKFTPALAGVVQRLLAHADELYARVDAGVALLPLPCRPGINAARFLYAAIGHEVARRGLDCVSARARVPGARKAWLLLRSVAQLAPTAAGPLPPLAATRFLVDAALAASPRERVPARRSVAERVVWTAELFARLEQHDQLRASRRSGDLAA